MNAPFGWPGGKRNLRKTLLQLIPQHEAYVEVFSGSAKLLFAKEPSAWEILNDVNDDLLNFFRVAKHRPAELAEELEKEIVASGRFRELRTTAEGGCATHASELQRALRFIYLTWFSFGSIGEHFASIRIRHLKKTKSPVRKSLDRVRELLEETAQRLRRVLIENRDFAACIGRYDSSDTFFYCDPPYSKFQQNGRYESLRERQAELFNLLAGIKGKFLLSFDDSTPIRALAGKHKFRMKRVQVNYSLAGNAERKKAGELLISNYGLR